MRRIVLCGIAAALSLPAFAQTVGDPVKHSAYKKCIADMVAQLDDKRSEASMVGAAAHHRCSDQFQLYIASAAREMHREQMSKLVTPAAKSEATKRVLERRATAGAN